MVLASLVATVSVGAVAPRRASSQYDGTAVQYNQGRRLADTSTTSSERQSLPCERFSGVPASPGHPSVYDGAENCNYDGQRSFRSIREGNGIDRGDGTDLPQLWHDPREAGFTGHRVESALALTYAKRRWLDSSTGTWLSCDDVGAASYLESPNELNPWQYAARNPTRYVDPSSIIPGSGEVYEACHPSARTSATAAGRQRQRGGGAGGDRGGDG